MTELIAQIALALSMLMSGASQDGAQAPAAPNGPAHMTPADSPVANPQPVQLPLPIQVPHL